MALRKALSYTHKIVVPFTRISSKKGKSYIKTVPPQSIVKFSMGSNDMLVNGKLPHVLTMVSTENAQVRHNALEASRQYINKQLDTLLPAQYFFKVIPFPHHIQRENKMLTGAGADRMQTGMQLSFGRSSGKAALLKEGSGIFMIATPTEKTCQIVREILKRVKPKLPCRTKLIYEVKTA
ncbi:MAG: 50S ribosomal protein L16 [Candidatus Pacearchaeota archaeon]|nr:50S ribosomal protein L16 [Candidatus Pacearchaeota archaeon]